MNECSLAPKSETGRRERTVWGIPFKEDRNGRGRVRRAVRRVRQRAIPLRKKAFLLAELPSVLRNARRIERQMGLAELKSGSRVRSRLKADGFSRPPAVHSPMDL
jgi:hypothetical protein